MDEAFINLDLAYFKAKKQKYSTAIEDEKRYVDDLERMGMPGNQEGYQDYLKEICNHKTIIYHATKKYAHVRRVIRYISVYQTMMKNFHTKPPPMPVVEDEDDAFKYDLVMKCTWEKDKDPLGNGGLYVLRGGPKNFKEQLKTVLPYPNKDEAAIDAIFKKHFEDTYNGDITAPWCNSAPPPEKFGPFTVVGNDVLYSPDKGDNSQKPETEVTSEPEGPTAPARKWLLCHDPPDTGKVIFGNNPR